MNTHCKKSSRQEGKGIDKKGELAVGIKEDGQNKGGSVLEPRCESLAFLLAWQVYDGNSE